MPPVFGWRNDVLDNALVARRVHSLSDYQTLNGCLEEITAGDEGELWLLCDAQTRLAERLTVAEAVRNRL
ncbi:hypothetical protein [Spirillospora sp. NBC_01491]|uniref:hypothetical protein n=1 Tax=Spirillospora sp. NBC_01491 TaxID=2976007 RepID=UPI002E325AFB|nr:hypothetical protein [Spirillospora sp. NBC_01491]